MLIHLLLLRFSSLLFVLFRLLAFGPPCRLVEVLSPDTSLLSGNVIDYALIHTSLASTTSLTTEWAIPWRPHALLSYHFNIERPPKSTDRSSISHRCQPHRTSISGLGPPTILSQRPMSWTSMEIQPMTLPNHGRTGFHALSSTSCRNTLGLLKAAAPTSGHVTNL